MVPIDFRLDEKDEKEYINKVLELFIHNQKIESAKKIKEFLGQIKINGTLMNEMDRVAKHFEKDYPDIGYLCMWLVIPYETLREIRIQTDSMLKTELPRINTLLKTFGIKESEKFHDLKKRIQRKKISNVNKNVWKPSGVVLEKYNKLYEYFACFDKIYKKFSKHKINQWIVEVTGLDVCPYCNISYTYNRKSNATAQLDHFFPKSEYPILSLCFYNLIPSCPACNRLKSDKSVEFASPYKKDAFRTMHIKWCFSGNAVDKNPKDLEMMIKLKIDSYEADEKSNIKEFRLMEAYEHHRDYASEVIRKAEIYLNKDAQKLLTSVLNYGGRNLLTPEEIERIYFSNYLQKEKIGKRSLAKMTMDIYEDLRAQK